MSDHEQGRELFRAAERDISALPGLGDTAIFTDEIFCFHVQQAAEKLFKARLASKGETCPLSYDLAALPDILSTGGADVARFDGLVAYTRHAVRLRDLSAGPGAYALDRSQAIKLLTPGTPP